MLDKGVLLDTEADAAPDLAERLARFVSTTWPSASPPGPGRHPCSVRTPRPPWQRPACPSRRRAGRGRRAGPGRPAHPVGFDLVGPAALAVLAALERPRSGPEPSGGSRSGSATGSPRAGRELTDDVLAEEAGLLGSHVHLDKGCYPGQETVARVHNLGQVQRRLAGLRFQPPGNGGPAALPAP